MAKTLHVKPDMKAQKASIMGWQNSVSFDDSSPGFKPMTHDPDEAPDETKAGGFTYVEYKAPVITPGGRVGDDAHHNYSPRDNWVDKRGGLPQYIREIRNGLVKDGHSESEATQLAIAAVKRWARGGGNVSPKVRAAAAKAVAQWEAMKASK